jgi:hypothetical protein
MKIAFVSQPIDTIVPPNQNSVGTCTLGVARRLARYADILIYGLKDNQMNSPASLVENGIKFRFLPSTRRENAFRCPEQVRKTVSPLHPVLNLLLDVS